MQFLRTTSRWLWYMSSFTCRNSSTISQQVSPSAKRPKMTSKAANAVIATHSGTFHCDEALGTWMLKQTKAFGGEGTKILRTRDPDLLKDADVVIDVGGIYDPASNRFDHHQRGFNETFGHGHAIKLSSAGLVYKHYGNEIIAKLMGCSQDEPDVQVVYLQVYKSFMEAIDAIDNGVNQFESNEPPKYVNNTHLSARVGNLNPLWNEESNDEVIMERFLQAVELTGKEFSEAVKYCAISWLPARALVLADIRARHDVDPSGQIVKLNSYCPWKEHLFQLEKEEGATGTIKYVIYEDDREKKWRIQAVAVAPGSFESRRPLPVAWRGLRDSELSNATQIPGCVFVHASGFIGGNDTEDGALQMAKKALEVN